VVFEFDVVLVAVHRQFISAFECQLSKPATNVDCLVTFCKVDFPPIQSAAPYPSSLSRPATVTKFLPLLRFRKKWSRADREVG